MTCIMCVHVWLRALVCHTDFSITIAATDFLSIKCPKNFHALDILLGFVDLGLKISE